MSQIKLTPGGVATLACMLEVSSPKPGNVHRGADFEDVTFVDFATSAVVLGDVIEACGNQTLGQTILAAIRRNEHAVGTNTNLGIVLLMVPLAKIAARHGATNLTSRSVAEYLSNLADSDGADVFEAIRMAKPGGLGEADELNVNSVVSEPIDLMGAMAMASDRDAIARQYVTGFQDIFDAGVPLIVEGRQKFGSLNQAIIYAHVALMARQADSLIARKCGAETAEHSKFLASKAIEIFATGDDSSHPDSNSVETSRAVSMSDSEKESFWEAVGELDFWLRSDGHRRNPGTTADLIAASLFVGIHNGTITAPFR